MPITVSHAKNNTIADFAGVVTVGNSSGGTNTMQGTDLVRPSDWNSTHLYTVQLTGSEVASLFTVGAGLEYTTNASGATIKLGEVEIFEPFPMPLTGTTSHTPGIGTWYFDNFMLPYALESGVIKVPVTNTTSGFQNGAVISANATSQGGVASITSALYHNLAIYTLGNGSDVTRIGTYWTGQMSIGVTEVKSVGSVATNSAQAQVSHYATVIVPGQWDLSANIVYSTITTSGTLSAAATSIAASSIDSLVSGAAAYYSGSRMDIIPVNTTFSGGMYVIAHQFSSAGGTTSSFSATGGGNYAAGTIFSTQVRPMMLEQNWGGYRQMGKSSSNTLSQAAPWHGFCTTAQSSAYSTIGSSDLRGTNVRLYWNFEERAVT